ncbi:MAG: type IV secretory system conjugative DNA transfer family protein [Nitrososphaerota archaeon]|nr:type IV secretory system conjugative DNA transfer family protein [Nitrososphaerota archaeon]MDG7013201.1 type IV secretory system conjugative DNA transfer family protein [Nitrososphaerota archaeon]MDG7026282.1 type IV secretory system conjugative DNA transfer family protein [Nitrososphaerota archaeon]
MGQTLDSDDMKFHMLVTGGTGSGKTNAVLHMLKLLFSKKEEGKPQPALFFFDPAGDASIDLVRAIPKSEWGRVNLLDPQYVTFGFNLLSLPEGLTPEEKPEFTHTQVDEFSVLLSDVFNTDSVNAPRLMWVFKGVQYFDYRFTPDPTLWEVYNITLDFTKRTPKEVEDLLNRKEVQKDIIRGTMEAISKLPQDAYMPVLNRISNFVLPQDSITFRTFCNRKSTFDLEKLMEPGTLTIFRVPPNLPSEFRRIFASAIVMKLYFASLKRASRLERAGQEPTARTPVIFAADEFRDIAQLRILRTILSQSRKYGLYLWMVSQTLSDIPEDLLASVEANVGPIIAFRSSSDDARRLSKVLYPERAEDVAELIPGLEDYSAVVRKRPVGGRPREPPFRVSFPKLPDPLSTYAEAFDFMKVDMEAKYGGATGDTTLIYKPELDQAAKERGDCWLGEPARWVPLAYLHCHGEMGFRALSRIFEDRYGWDKKILQFGLDKLFEGGYVAKRPGIAQLFVEIDPETGLAAYKEPETDDEKRKARDMLYSTTPASEEEFFKLRVSETTDRPGDPLHLRAIEALLEEYWDRGYWCVWDRGDENRPLPDILITKPVTVRGKAREGRPTVYLDPDKWDEKKEAAEVEVNPRKNLAQLRANYDKNYPKYSKVRFVVVSVDLASEVRRILEDKEKGTFDVVFKDLGLQKDELERLMAEEEKAKEERLAVQEAAGKGEGADATPTAGDKSKKVEARPVPASLQDKEFRLLAIICESGWNGRKALALGLGISGRQVTRYLDSLADKKLVQKKGKGYQPTDAGRNLVAEAGPASSDPQARLD